MLVNSCELCSGSNFKLLFEASDFNLRTTAETFKVVRCRSCGLIFLNPMPELQESSQYYPDEYFATVHWEKVPIEKLCKIPLIYDRIQNLNKYIKAGKLLDVGCGVGFFIAALSYLGWEAIGIEVSKTAAEFGKRQWAAKILDCRLDEAILELEPAQFDVVTFYHVIEHLQHPLSSLKQAHRLLKGGGLLVVEVPNIASWQAKLLGRWWYCLDVPRHLYHYTPKTLERIINKAGFQVLEIRHLKGWGAGYVVETSIIHWIRELYFKFIKKESSIIIDYKQPLQTPQQKAPKVMPTIPKFIKRAFRLCLRFPLYAPLAPEAYFKHSIIIQAYAVKK